MFFEAIFLQKTAGPYIMRHQQSVYLATCHDCEDGIIYDRKLQTAAQYYASKFIGWGGGGGRQMEGRKENGYLIACFHNNKISGHNFFP
jgi:hypothetical protein